MRRFAVYALLAVPLAAQDPDAGRPRARAAGVVVGSLPPGPLDAITDVAGVRVGHCTVREGDDVRTGVTVVLPHAGNLFADKVPCGIHVLNGFGKLAGSTQVDELGELETPIALTNTLAVGTAVQALVAWTLQQPGNESVRSVNAVVGETNDGRLSAIRRLPVRAEHVAAALAAAADGAFACGAVGAGTGTICCGFKGGIGTASRRVGAFTVGVLVQSNFGGRLRLGGRELLPAAAAAPAGPGGPAGAGGRTGRDDRQPQDDGDERGSCMIVIATDAPLLARNLQRLAARAFAGMARTGASFSNGSGDYAIAFSTAAALRIRAGAERTGGEELANAAMTPLFLAVAEATEAAIVDSLCAAAAARGNGVEVPALPVDAARAALQR